MSQSVILDNFILYLHLKKTEKNSQYDPVMVDNLIQGFKEGNCWAFSLCYAVEAQENIKYWRTMLWEVYHWSGTPKTLAKDIFLPGSLRKEKLKLGDLFERMIHYIAFHQLSQTTRLFLTVYKDHKYWKKSHYVFACSVPPIDFKHLSHHNILGTGVEFFELINNRHKVKHIRADTTIKDQFIAEELSYLLDENIIKDCICLIYTDKHAIAIIYDRGLLGIYDPNYQHESIRTLDKFFANKTKFAEEIICILGNFLTIKLASFEQRNKEKLISWKRDFLNFKKKLVTATFDVILNIKNNNLLYFTFPLLKNKKIDNLTIFAKISLFFPNYLESFLLLAERNEKISQLLCELIYTFDNFPVFFNFLLKRPKALVSLLKISTEEKISSFFNFIIETPDAFFSLLKISIDKEVTCSIQLLFAVNEYGKTALEVLQSENAAELTNLLKLVKRSSAASETFFAQIKLHEQKAIDFLDWIKFLDKRNFSTMLSILENTLNGAMWLDKQLFRRNKTTGEVAIWGLLKNRGNQYLPLLLAVVAKINNKLSDSIGVLKEKYTNDLCGGETFQDYQKLLYVESKKAVKLNTQIVHQSFFCKNDLLSSNSKMPVSILQHRNT